MTKGAREVLRTIIREAKHQARLADDDIITVRLRMAEASTSRHAARRCTKVRSMTYTMSLPPRKVR